MKSWRILAKYCSTEGKVESFFKNQIDKVNKFHDEQYSSRDFFSDKGLNFPKRLET